MSRKYILRTTGTSPEQAEVRRNRTKFHVGPLLLCLLLSVIVWLCAVGTSTQGSAPSDVTETENADAAGSVSADPALTVPPVSSSDTAGSP